MNLKFTFVMRRLFTLCVFAIFLLNGFSGVFGQVKIGVNTGLNVPMMIGQNYFSEHGYQIRYPQKHPSFHGGIAVDVAITKLISVQPEILYSTSGYDWFSSGEEFSSWNSSTDPNISESLAFVSVPLLFKVKLGGLALVFGPQLNKLLSAKRYINDTGNNEAKQDYNMGNTFSGIVGLEYTFRFGLGFHARYQYAFESIAKVTEDGIYAEGNEMKNNGAMVGLHMMFGKRRK